ncbi:MAG: NfeD family protein [Eubacteriales bacterium]
MFVGISLSLIVIGIILIFLEIFIIPGFGVSGILGFLLLFGGIFSAADTLIEGVIYFLITFIVIGLLVYIGVKTGKVSKLWGKISLREQQQNSDGYVAPKPEYERYLGKKGVAITDLRPAGSVKIEDERVDVVTEGGYIEPGTPIRVLAVEGTRVIVREDLEENK